jgi:hypothetical protein
MRTQIKSQNGQALVLIVFAIIGLFGLVALAMDGGHAFADRRQAQNAVDNAALAAALAYQQKDTAAVIQTKVLASTTSNGYPTGTDRCTVTFDPDGTLIPGICPDGSDAKEFQISILSNLDTWFGPIVGVKQVHNRVYATSRACAYHYEPFYDGNAVVSLAPGNEISFNASGHAKWNIACDDAVSGGIFANGAANQSGSATVNSPSLTVVGDGASEFTTVEHVVSGATPYAYPLDILAKMPRQPLCNGAAKLYPDGKYYPQLLDGSYYPDHVHGGVLDVGTNLTQKDGSVIPVKFNGGQTYTSGLYCVTQIGVNFSGTLVADSATFYILKPDFDLKLAGEGDGLAITAPTTGEYAHYAIILPLTCGSQLCDINKLKATPPTQVVDPCTGPSDKPRLDLRGNGDTGITGAILAPSACITMYGNAISQNHGQLVGYTVDGGGTSNINVCFKAPENPQEYYPPILELVK